MGFPNPRQRETASLFQIVSLSHTLRPTRLVSSYGFLTFGRKLDEPDKIGRDGETPLELTKIYLSCLHDHFISILEKKLSRSVVQMTPMDFVVTVPAIWSNTAKQATERAAAMAGFCGNRRIHLISEPVCD